MGGVKIDLTGMKMDKRCKVCVMHDWNMELFLKVHELRLVDNHSNQAVQKYANTEISEFNKTAGKGKGQTFLSDSSVSNHFSKHVPAPLAINAQIKTALQGSQYGQEAFPPKAEKALKKMEATVEQQNLDELQKFSTLVDRVALRFDQLDQNIPADGVLTMEHVASFRALAELLGRMRKDMIQLRNQDKILQTALTSVLDTFSLGATEAVLKGITLLMSDYSSQFKDPHTAEVLGAKLRELLGTSMIASAKTALQAVRQQLKTA
jgi:hypothetical protein